MSVWNEKCILSPSLICLDMCNLERQARALEDCGVRLLHVDILDGHFSPSMPLGLDTVRQLRARTNLEFDCHVMVTEQDFFVDELLDIVFLLGIIWCVLKKNRSYLSCAAGRTVHMYKIREYLF